MKQALFFLRLGIFLLACLLFGSSPLCAQTNEGEHFWFGFMEHIDVGNNSKVAMITSKSNTSGMISVPLVGWNEPFSVAANQVTIITLPDFTENVGSELINNVGVKVFSNDPVSVYIHQFHTYRSEASVVLPVSSLGNQYYAMSYRGYADGSGIYPSEFLIVGTKDETTISITVSAATKGGKPAGTTFDVVLDIGETYQVQAATVTGDLSGSFISGDKNFALFSGNSWTEVPVNCAARDNLLEQMFPLSTWGRRVATVPNAGVNFDVFRIMAAENNTNVEILTNGTTQNYTLNAGEFAEYQQTQPSLITADKAIQVAQYNVGQGCSGHPIGDPSMVLLNSIEQTRDTVTLFNSSLDNILENYINIFGATDDFSLITLDGQPIPANAETGTIGANDEYSYARIRVNTGAHTIISQGCGVIATAYGYGDAESYAYSGGASFNSINNNPIPEGGCLNDTILFDANLPENRYTFEWDLGDGATSTEATFQHFYPNLGSYPVQLVVTDGCQGTVDTFRRDLLITLRQAVTTLGDVNVCEGSVFELGATDLPGASYEWTGPNGYFSEEQFPMIQSADTTMTGLYEVIGIVSGCATFPTTSEVAIAEAPVPDLGPDTVFCNFEKQFSLNPAAFSTYLWQDNSTLPFYNVLEEGLFSVKVTNEHGCEGEDMVELKKVCPTKIYIPNAFSPNFDGINDQFEVYGEDIINMQLTIYDRWGNMLFQGKEISQSWNGKAKGKIQAQGIYIWTLEIEGYREDGSTYEEVLSGDVLLIR